MAVAESSRKVLVVEPDPARATSLREYLADLENVEVVFAEDGARGAELLRDGGIDCAIVNPETPDLDLSAVMERVRDVSLTPPPVIAFGQRLASVGAASVALASIPGVREVHSLERLIDELVRALHIDLGHVPERYRKVIDEIHGSTRALAGRRVLIVDDDIRNIFALSSVLEDYGMEIKTADNGRDAIAIAHKGGIDVVLMDIMMPEMDGYATMQVIRQNISFRRLPIIALTAKAMKGDREKCLEAGASDYLAKPVNTDQLLSALRMWLHR